jgi:site-specific DNA-methyltransferase (adenine-specific)
VNPVLRDVTERVVIASKGRFDRALSAAQRAKRGLPHESTVAADDFMALTLDVWSMQPESARRIGHPAPFPIELPEQLIRLYTFENDLVLDPFMGSGTTLLAAGRLGRRFVGYDLDPSYVELARERVTAGLAGATRAPGRAPFAPADEGRSVAQLAEAALTEAGITIVKTAYRVPKSGVTVPFLVQSPDGPECAVDIAGAFTSTRGGMSRSETVWRTLGRAAAVRAANPDLPVIVLTTELPRKGGDADQALRAAVPGLIRCVVDLLDPADRARLATLL